MILSERKKSEDMNYVDVTNSTQSFMQGIGQYSPNQQRLTHQSQGNHSRVPISMKGDKQNLHNISEEDEMRQSQKGENIQMIDSMILVEHEQEENEDYNRPEIKIVLEESIILRGIDEKWSYLVNFVQKRQY